jgi:hypothetical protein
MIAARYDWTGLPQAIIGRRLALNVPGRCIATTTFRVTGFSADVVRVTSSQNKRSDMALSLFRDAIATGTLVFVDDPV